MTDSKEVCDRLVETATRDIYRRNVFRITGLPVGATAREAAKHVDRLKMTIELGGTGAAGTSAFRIIPAPSMDQVRDAMQRLKDPEQRVIDELFWLWPTEYGDAGADVALKACEVGDSQLAISTWRTAEGEPGKGIVAKHNLAVAYHLVALDWELSAMEHEVSPENIKQLDSYWRKSRRRWDSLAEDDRFWDLLANRVVRLNEPGLSASFVKRLREGLPRALSRINADLALALAEGGDVARARQQVALVQNGRTTPEEAGETLENILQPWAARLRGQIKSAAARGEKNPRDGLSAARDLIAQGLVASAIFERLLGGRQSPFRAELFDEVAEQCNVLQIVFDKANDDNAGCLDVLERIDVFATNAPLRDRLKKNAGILRNRIAANRLEPIFAALKAIQDSTETPIARLASFHSTVMPKIAVLHADKIKETESFISLCDSAAIVLRGISLDAWNKNTDAQTALAAVDLALGFGRELKLMSQLLADQAMVRGFVANRAAVQRKSRNKAWGYLGFVGLVMLIGFCSSGNKATSGGAVANSSPREVHFDPSAPVQLDSGSQAPAASPSYDPKPELDRELQEINDEKAKGSREIAELDSLSNEIERERPTLGAQSTQYDYDAFNAKVTRYNALLEEEKQQVQLVNQMVGVYNGKLQLLNH